MHLILRMNAHLCRWKSNNCFFSYSHVIVVSGVLTPGLIQLAWTRFVGQAAQTAT